LTGRSLYEAARARRESGAPAGLRTLAAPPGVEVEPIGYETNDSDARLTVRKRLYDFGRTRAATAAARSLEHASRLQLGDVIQQRRLEIMERFFDVLLADLAYARDNEAMSIAYVRFDDARDRRELGRISDIEVLERESRFQNLRSEMRRSQTRQRATRAALALALGRAEDLPGDLVYPELPSLEREPPALEDVTARALERNPRLEALRAEVEALAERVLAARRDASPVLRGELEAGAYASPRPSDDELSAALVLEWPLMSGGRVEAEVARARAALRAKRAELAEAQLEVRQAVLEQWLELDALGAEREAVSRLAEYRELYLDRSRALYALELTTDLGDAMTRISEVRWREARAELHTELAWARLDALAGATPYEAGAGPDADGRTAETPK
jgi:outer membrane protein TolC